MDQLIRDILIQMRIAFKVALVQRAKSFKEIGENPVFKELLGNIGAVFSELPETSIGEFLASAQICGIISANDSARILSIFPDKIEEFNPENADELKDLTENMWALLAKEKFESCTTDSELAASMFSGLSRGDVVLRGAFSPSTGSINSSPISQQSHLESEGAPPSSGALESQGNV